jgi:hypothetical protein
MELGFRRSASGIKSTTKAFTAKYAKEALSARRKTWLGRRIAFELSGFRTTRREDVVSSVFADGPEERLPSFARLDSRGRLSPHEPLSLCNLDVCFGYAFRSFRFLPFANGAGF